MALNVEKPRIRNSSGQYSARGMLTAKLLRAAYGRAGSPTPMAPAVPLTFDATASSLFYFDTKEFVADKVDKTNAVIRGVSVITGGITARGHDLEVDETTLKQMMLCAQAKGQVPVKVDHKSGAAAVCGFLSDFRLESNKLKADWHLLQSHPQKDQILEVAERMPRGVGLSAAFIGPDKPERTTTGKNAARCAELISVDYVTTPAANPDGMFSAKVDSHQIAMNPEILAAIKAAIAEAVGPLSQQIADQAEQFKTLTNPPTLEQLAQMDDAELAKYDLTPDDIAAALDELANGDETQEVEGETEAAAPTGDESTESAAPALAGASPAVAAAFDALTKQVTELSAKLGQSQEAKEKSEVETLFASVNAKIDEISSENTHLRNSLRAGGTAAKPGVDRNNIRFFSAKKNEGKFENLVQFEIESNNLTKGKAFAAVQKFDPDAYRDYLVRLNVLSADTQ